MLKLIKHCANQGEEVNRGTHTRVRVSAHPNSQHEKKNLCKRQYHQGGSPPHLQPGQGSSWPPLPARAAGGGACRSRLRNPPGGARGRRWARCSRLRAPPGGPRRRRQAPPEGAAGWIHILPRRISFHLAADGRPPPGISPLAAGSSLGQTHGREDARERGLGTARTGESTEANFVLIKISDSASQAL